MVPALASPEVLRCYFDESFDPPFPAMCLRWPADLGEQSWQLPEGVCVFGPAPRQFGVHLRRQADDAYAVRLLWDRTCFSWLALSREQLLNGSLAFLLAALGTDLWGLLEQPVCRAGGPPIPVA